MRSHGTEIRGLTSERPPTLSPLLEGRFGRMFRRLPPAPAYGEDELRGLAETMRDSATPSGGWGGQVEDRDNPGIPAAYTYLGQFIDHDITFDPMSSLQKLNDPDALVDFRTPRFDLDSLYGSGPADEPFQYINAPGASRFLVNESGTDPRDFDLPRNSEGIALIGDPRNDENIIVSQLHVVFLRAHNKFVSVVDADSHVPDDQRFDDAQKLLRWHYQWMVVNDYLPRIVDPELVERLFNQDAKTGEWEIKRHFYRPQKKAYMPVEFSVAAFRFGHSMIRGIYNLNDVVKDRPIFAPGDEVGPLDDLRGRRALPAQWTIGWNSFLPIGDSTPQPSRRIDARLVDGLFDLPGRDDSLALLNLKRGQAFQLPSGQDVARALGNEKIFTGAELNAPEPTPLWFYILKESELEAAGAHLGATGGRIVAEVLLGLLETDSQSFFSQDPNWSPQTADVVSDADGDGSVGLSDLVHWATS